MSEKNNQSANVLVIDDESSILESLRILLRNEGFTPHVAQGGRQGLEQIASLSQSKFASAAFMRIASGDEERCA